MVVRRWFDPRRLERLRGVSPLDLPFRPREAQELFSALLPRICRIAEEERLRARQPSRSFDDNVQDACLRLWCTITTLPSLEESVICGRVRVVVHRVTVDASRARAPLIESDGIDPRAVADRAESRSGSSPFLGATIPETQTNPEALAIANERGGAVRSAMAKLPPRQRNVLIRWAVHGESIASIARQHGADERTIRRDLKAAKIVLQRLLRRYAESEPAENGREFAPVFDNSIDLSNRDRVMVASIISAKKQEERRVYRADTQDQPIEPGGP